MLERPDVVDQSIATCLLSDFDVLAEEIVFLPLGADVNTAVCRVLDEENVPFFLKLRKGAFAESSVALPKFFSDQGMAQIIPPLETVSGGLWGTLDSYKTILYPYIDGRNGYEIPLSDRHWQEFGAIAYYRFERIIQDIAAFCQQLLLSDEGGADREQSLLYFKSNFLPGDTIEIAYASPGCAL